MHKFLITSDNDLQGNPLENLIFCQKNAFDTFDEAYQNFKFTQIDDFPTTIHFLTIEADESDFGKPLKNLKTLKQNRASSPTILDPNFYETDALKKIRDSNNPIGRHTKPALRK